MKGYKIFLIFIVILFYSCNNTDEISSESEEIIEAGEFIDDWTYRVYPSNSSNFNIGEFRVWIPETSDNLRAILVLANSYNSNGLGMVNNIDWQDFARKENLALLSIHFKNKAGSRSYYAEASNGSGKAMLLALEKIAQKHQLDFLNFLPLMVRGYSAGGVFGYYLSEFLPERVLAFANIRGGNMEETNNLNNNTLGMMIIGENDSENGMRNMINHVNMKRKQNGLWCYLIEPEADHFANLDKSDALIKVFFFMALGKKLPKDNSKPLISIPESSGWLGNNESKEYYSFLNYSNDKTQSSWLINEEFAEYWRDFQLN